MSFRSSKTIAGPGGVIGPLPRPNKGGLSGSLGGRDTEKKAAKRPKSKKNTWDKDLPSQGMKANINRKRHIAFFAWTAETCSTIKVVCILYFVWDPESESESEPESESIRNPESEPESESEQPRHDSAPLDSSLMEKMDTSSKTLKLHPHAFLSISSNWPRTKVHLLRAYLNTM